jgi:sugar phosphate isomerase/epimerase
VNPARDGQAGSHDDARWQSTWLRRVFAGNHNGEFGTEFGEFRIRTNSSTVTFFWGSSSISTASWVAGFGPARAAQNQGKNNLTLPGFDFPILEDRAMNISRRRFAQISATAAVGAMSPKFASGSKESKQSFNGINLSCMVWRIGDILDFDKQVEWIASAGFESISFHASAGEPGKWRGIEPAAADQKERRRIKGLLARFAVREIHAPFDAKIQPETLSSILEKLEEVLRFASDVGGAIVTVHADPPAQSKKTSATAWDKALDRLDAAAAAAGLRIGLELNRGFEWLRKPRRRRIGATLDVGHMYLRDGAGFRPYGTIGALIRSLNTDLFHLHLHDYDGQSDHIEIGTGQVDFGDILKALDDIGFRGALCLELNPDRCQPEGIRRSADYLRKRAAKLK